MTSRTSRSLPFAAVLLLCSLAACSDHESGPSPAPEAPASSLELPPATSSAPPAAASPNASERMAPSGEDAAPLDRSPLGIFEGTLPCADCTGVRTELTLYLQPDTFVLRETYLGRADGEKTITTQGHWEAALGIDGDPDATVIRLGPDQPDSMRVFREAGSDRLELLDRSGRVVESTPASVLVRRADAKGGS